MSILRSTFLCLALAGTASAGDRMAMPGAGAVPAVPRTIPVPVKTAPTAPARLPSLPSPARGVAQSPGAAPALAGKTPAPGGAKKRGPARRWSLMKNKPMSPPVAPRAFAGAPEIPPPGGGVPGKGVRGLRLTPLDHGIRTSAKARALRGSMAAPPASDASSKPRVETRTQKPQSDADKRDEATKKAIADNIRG